MITSFYISREAKANNRSGGRRDGCGLRLDAVDFGEEAVQKVVLSTHFGIWSKVKLN